MRIPIALKVLALVLSLTAFYSFVGQMVPQHEAHPPPIVRIGKEVGVEDMVVLGKELFEGKGTCTLCHTIGNSTGPLRFPDLADIGARAGQRIPGLDDVGYLAQSLYEPNAFVVEGFVPGMPVANKPPIELTGDEILAVIAYLQSLGGEPSVTMETRLADREAESVAGPLVGETGNDAQEVETHGVDPPAIATLSEGAPVAASAAIDNGRRLYNLTCFVCHGNKAQGNELLSAPRLAGQESWYIARQLKNFAAGLRGGDPNDVFGAQMRPMAMTLKGESEIEDLAAYLSSLD